MNYWKNAIVAVKIPIQSKTNMKNKTNRRNFISKTFTCATALGLVGVTSLALETRKSWKDVGKNDWCLKYKKNAEFDKGVDWGVTQSGEFYLNNYQEKDTNKIAKYFFDNVFTFSDSTNQNNYIMNSSSVAFFNRDSKAILKVSANGDCYINESYAGNFKARFV